MATEPEQNFANHSRVDYVYFGGIFLVLIGVITAGYVFFTTLSIAALGNLIFTIGVACGYARIRPYGLRVQDRIIMLEMRLRLERILGSGSRDTIMKLTRPQLIALRFASDSELPELVDKTVKGDFPKGSDIKKAIKHWQADYHRV